MSPTEHRLRLLFTALLASASVHGLCGDCDVDEFIVPRVIPANPGGTEPPAFDPAVVSDAECQVLCGAGNDGCEPLTLENGTPAVWCVVYSDCGAGRRPDGLVDPACEGAADPIGAWLARAAHLELASVVAFRRMTRELERLGAPASLVARARTAVRDEARHARTMRGLARGRGAVVSPVAVATPAARTPVAIAIENVAEGCIAETFAALVAHHQAAHATDPAVRSAMQAIAIEESAHAALAWDVHAWIVGTLSAPDRRRVQRARRAATRKLVGRWSSHPAARAALGLPSSDVGRALAASMTSAMDPQ